MEENAQLIVDKQNRSAYKFSLLSSTCLFYLIWENIIRSRSFFSWKFHSPWELRSSLLLEFHSNFRVWNSY